MPLITTTDSTLELKQGETLLHALIRTGHEVAYQCCNGYCGSCRIKIKQGRVSYPEPPLAFLMPDEILPCCCRVETNLTIVCALRCADTEIF